MSRSLSLLLVLVLAAGGGILAVTCSGCGGKEDKTAPGGTQPAGGGGTQSPAGGTMVDLKDAGKITGKVNFDGTPSAPEKKAIGDAFCSAANPDGYLSDALVVNPNKTLKFVVVHVKKGLEGKTFPPASAPAKLDQKNCRYVPHVQVIRTGQELVIANSDDTLHNVHWKPSLNEKFNLGQPKKGEDRLSEQKGYKFTKAEAVKINCDVHNHMEGYIYVLAHPCGAVTGDDGTYTIENVPPGEYELTAWHEKLGTKTAKVKVDAKGTATADFTFKD